MRMKTIKPTSAKEAPETSLPPDLRKTLATTTATGAAWNDLTPIARRDFVSWIESAKQPETRRRRIERVPEMLASGKRRPCCYAVVPMNLYTALGANPKAKAQWKDLTPDERRDFVSWIESVKQAETRIERVAKVCALLAAGKRRP